MRILSVGEIPMGESLSNEEDLHKKELEIMGNAFARKLGFACKITISVSGCQGAVCPKIKHNAHIHTSISTPLYGTICLRKQVLGIAPKKLRWLIAHEVAHLRTGPHSALHRAWTAWLLDGLSPAEERTECRKFYKEVL